MRSENACGAPICRLPQAARELTRAAVALPDENDSAWELLEALRASARLNGARLWGAPGPLAEGLSGGKLAERCG